jgi:hypothetical protein
MHAGISEAPLSAAQSVEMDEPQLRRTGLR